MSESASTEKRRKGQLRRSAEYYTTALAPKRIEQAIETCKGRFGAMCRFLSVGPEKLRQALTDDHWDLMRAQYELIVDEAEDVIIKCIRSGDKIAAMFFLKCHGKARGWIERSEHQHQVAIQAEVSTDEERVKRIKALLVSSSVASPAAGDRSEQSVHPVGTDSPTAEVPE